jgi:hypothetical protein
MLNRADPDPRPENDTGEKYESNNDKITTTSIYINGIVAANGFSSLLYDHVRKQR